LLQYGGTPVFIYAATLITIVATDLLTGILVGLGCSLLKVLYGLTRMEVRVSGEGRGRIDLQIAGAATFIRMPKLIDALDSLPRDREVHVCCDGLVYIDHACMDAISNWQRQRSDKGARIVVEWNHLMAAYRRQNGLRPAEALVEAGSR
jgi:MFS superfamily sulfate permease-like transporter